MNDHGVILEVKQLRREITVKGEKKVIVDDITFQFEKGKIYCIIGPSGAGKTSFLRLLNRLDEPTGGNIVFNTESIEECVPCKVRRNIGYVFQTPYLFHGTVRDNLLYAEASLSPDAILKLVKQTQIPEKIIDADVENLSIGEKQRVSLARVLAMNPKVILLDEPTSALDPSFTEAIENLIKSIVKERALTVIMVTHNPEQALRMSGDGILLVNGKLIESGPIEKVVNDPQSELGKKYRKRELR
ncbi:MAG: ABC transporter ATP-binding protein [Candidatus Zixiibacteriota bacterium]